MCLLYVVKKIFDNEKPPQHNYVFNTDELLFTT